MNDHAEVLQSLRDKAEHDAGYAIVPAERARHEARVEALDAAIAALEAGRSGEAVAWQVRFKFPHGEWSGWCQMQSEEGMKHRLARYEELGETAEGRALYAAAPQQPPPEVE